MSADQGASASIVYPPDVELEEMTLAVLIEELSYERNLRAWETTAGDIPHSREH